MRRPCRQWRHIDRGPAGRASERGIPRLSARSRWKQAGRGCPSGFLIIFRAEENRSFGAVLLNGYTQTKYGDETKLPIYLNRERTFETSQLQGLEARETVKAAASSPRASLAATISASVGTVARRSAL